MKKSILIAAATVLAIGLLTACGKTNTHDSMNDMNYASGHDQHQSEGQKDDHKDAGKVTFAFDGGAAQANEDTKITIRITDKDGQPVKEFQINHEKLLHLIVVNRDLSYFSHIHPDYQGNGAFTVTTRFPSGGKYELFADFMPVGGSNQTKSEWVDIKGTEGPHNPIIPDMNLVKQIGNKEIELKLSGSKAKADTTLTFNIRDAATKKGINNLEPYLGAVGHVVIISEDGSRYLHVHPLDEKATGPDAAFMTSFPESGVYKIWGQFQQNGEVFTVPFVVKVD